MKAGAAFLAVLLTTAAGWTIPAIIFLFASAYFILTD